MILTTPKKPEFHPSCTENLMDFYSSPFSSCSPSLLISRPHLLVWCCIHVTTPEKERTLQASSEQYTDNGADNDNLGFISITVNTYVKEHQRSKGVGNRKSEIGNPEQGWNRNRRPGLVWSGRGFNEKEGGKVIQFFSFFFSSFYLSFPHLKSSTMAQHSTRHSGFGIVATRKKEL